MREILFKAKAANREEGREYRTNYKNGDWVYGLLTDPKNYLGFAEMTNTNGVSGIEVDPETVCQWTGLVDKNGVKIFEGDIVKTDKFGEPNKIYVIEYNLLFGAFIGTDGYGMYFATFDGDSDQFEVIDSIHDKAVEE